MSTIRVRRITPTFVGVGGSRFNSEVIDIDSGDLDMSTDTVVSGDTPLADTAPYVPPVVDVHAAQRVRETRQVSQGLGGGWIESKVRDMSENEVSPYDYVVIDPESSLHDWQRS
jgi:hypothetical protein